MKIDRSELGLSALALGIMVMPRLSGVIPSMPRPVVLSSVVAVAVVGLRSGSRALVALAVVMAVVIRGGTQLDSLRQPLPVGPISGEARLVTDPTQRNFDVQAILSVEGRRYVASMPSAEAVDFRSMQVGETVAVEGTPRAIEGAPVGWVLSNHLAGRLRIESITTSAPAPPWYRIANRIRALIARSGSSMSPENRALYLGLVVGDDREQSELQKYRFKASGLSHLLAVSGQNVAFVLAIASPLTRRLGPRRSIAVAVPLLAIFTLVTRAEPSVLRAVTMTSIVLVALAVGRPVQGLRILSLTVIGLVLVDPLIVHSMAFILSVSATSGLIVLAQPLSAWLRGPPWLTEPLAVTVAAQLATAPVLFTMTGSLPSVATPANLLAVPVSGFVMMAGLTVGLLAGSLRSEIGAVLMWPVEWMVRWVGWVANSASRLPLAQLTPVRLVVLVTVVAGAVMAIRSFGSHGTNRDTRWRWVVGAIGLVGAVGLVVPTPIGVDAIDVDRGATLVRTTCGDSVLIVTKGVKGIDVLESLDDLGVGSVDVVVSDTSSTARRAARYVEEQYRGVRIVEVGVDDVPTVQIGVDDVLTAKGEFGSCR